MMQYEVPLGQSHTYAYEVAGQLHWPDTVGQLRNLVSSQRAVELQETW